MALAVGSRIGPYEVLAALGAGGMGEVYRARDSKLNRDVALKILPEVSAADPDVLARFKREAQVLASLNHPHVAAIYGFEDSGTTHALVLELVEGKTLAERIAEGRLPINEALSIAGQIAEAIEAACEQGVIHRDLKPGNIKLRPNGTVKVLDFGLAKLAHTSGSEPRAFNQSQSPTMMSPAATGRGVIVGTAAYMSPEQARGLPVDRQTDIWAFGCVLFEMLSGRPAFAGQTFSDTIVNILDREPGWEHLPASTPARIRDLLRRCLQKNQQRRLHDIADARLEIEDASIKAPRHIVALPMVMAGIAVSLALVLGTWWFARGSVPLAPHDPVSVLIADFVNGTSDPTFDRTLEPLLRIVLEGADFISAYDRTQVSRGLGVQPPATLDETAARQFAVRQGLNVVMSGSLEREGTGYRLAMKAVQVVTGSVISSVQGTITDKNGVLPEATRLVTEVREALGDDTSDAARRFAMETLSATSLEVVRDFATGMEQLSNNETELALGSFTNAVTRDQTFGLAHAGRAIAAWNLDRRQEAEKYVREAVRYVDRMTERERYRTRGLFYLITSDYQQCVKEYGDLVARYVSDAGARNNLALCSTQLRDMPTALDQMRRAATILPNRSLYRLNLALYAAYAGDFKTAEQEARETERLGSALGLLPRAFAQLGQGQLGLATESYQQLAKVSLQGAFFSASGLADLAVYEGRFSDAIRILEQNAAANVKSNDVDRAASQFVSLANVHVLRRQRHAAVAAIEDALANSEAIKIRFLSARALIEVGDVARARSLAARLASELQSEPQAYSKILEGEAALKMGDPREAIRAFVEANTLLDSWLGHFGLGRAYLEAEAYTQADSEFDRCLKRRGEAISLFLDEEPTYGVIPPVYYYQGRVREGLKAGGFAESYRTYLNIRGKSREDLLVAEIQNRLRQ